MITSNADWAHDRLLVQTEDEVVVQSPETTQPVHHATDEEKLASTGIAAPTTDGQEEKGESECSKAPGKKQPIGDISATDGMFQTDEVVSRQTLVVISFKSSVTAAAAM